MVLDRIKNAFDVEKFIISEASHKLKTPVTVIKGYCDVILQRERDNSEYVETLQSIKRVTVNISNLISGIMTVTTLNSGHLTYQVNKQTEINQIILKAVELSTYLADQKKVTINFAPQNNIPFTGDEDKLIEAIFNIIENGIKYNREYGSVKISVKQEINKVIISINDTGIGIESDERDKIFERFYRTGLVSKIEGHGLGLNIAKMIVEAHSGTISVNSKINSGTEFLITLQL